METKAPCGIHEISDLHYINICSSCKIRDIEICDRCNHFGTVWPCAHCIRTGEKSPSCKYIKKEVRKKHGYKKDSLRWRVRQAGHAIQKGFKEGIELHDKKEKP